MTMAPGDGRQGAGQGERTPPSKNGAPLLLENCSVLGFDERVLVCHVLRMFLRFVPGADASAAAALADRLWVEHCAEVESRA